MIFIESLKLPPVVAAFCFCICRYCRQLVPLSPPDDEVASPEHQVAAQRQILRPKTTHK